MLVAGRVMRSGVECRETEGLGKKTTEAQRHREGAEEFN
jgi:hypothetical protein